MPDQRFKPGFAQRTEIPRPKRGEGQWALGFTEPLNKNEQSKKDDDPLNVRDRILNIYSKRGFDSIDPADLRGRFRWMGLYTQRKPGIDGGRTASLGEEELDTGDLARRLTRILEDFEEDLRAQVGSRDVKGFHAVMGAVQEVTRRRAG